MKYSLVVPVFNERDSLPKFLEAISFLKIPPHEIHFIDSGSNDGSYGLLAEFLGKNNAKFEINLHSNPGGYPGSNRNMGIVNSKSEWIAFLDVGVMPNPDYIECLMNSVIHTGCNHAYSMCFFTGRTKFQIAICALTYGYKFFRPTLPGGVFHASLFLPKNAGLFESDLRAAEDLLWMRKLHKFTPKNVVNNAIVNYADFPINITECVNKFWTYQIAQTASKIAQFRIWGVLLFFLLVMPISFYLDNSIGIFLAMTYLIFRGIIEPIRRSNKIYWFKTNHESFLICIWLGPLIDFVKVASLGRRIFGGTKK